MNNNLRLALALMMPESVSELSEEESAGEPETASAEAEETSDGASEEASEEA